MANINAFPRARRGFVLRRFELMACETTGSRSCFTSRGAALSVATPSWPEAWTSAFDRCEPRALPAFSYKSSPPSRGQNCLCSARMSAHVFKKVCSTMQCRKPFQAGSDIVEVGEFSFVAEGFFHPVVICFLRLCRFASELVAASSHIHECLWHIGPTGPRS